MTGPLFELADLTVERVLGLVLKRITPEEKSQLIAAMQATLAKQERHDEFADGVVGVVRIVAGLLV